MYKARPHRTIPGSFKDNLLLFSGNANPALSKEIARYLETRLGNIEASRFADGEFNIRIEENVRGKDCFVIQPTCRPANENIIELLLTIDALLRASAAKITAVIPYFGYAGADRKTAPRMPI